MKTLSNESQEARKAGPTTASSIGDLAKLLTKVRAKWQEVTSTINKLKPKAEKAAKEAEAKAKETKDANAFKPILAKAKGEVTAAENAANEVSRKATPVIANPGEEGEEQDKKVAAVEKAATEAVKKIEEARTSVNEKLKSIQTYAPEAKRTAHAALAELQKKLSDAIKSANVYKGFKRNLPSLAESQNIIKEISEKLTGHESNLAKAGELAKATAMTKGKLAEIDKQLEPVIAASKEANVSLNKKEIRMADAVTQEKAGKLRTKNDELKKKIEEVNAKVKDVRSEVQSEEATAKAKEHLEKAQAGWKECGEAEMPFLMGVEVLGGEENDKAIEACKTAATTTSAALSSGKNFIRQKLGEARAYAKELAASTKAALDPIMKDLDAIETKFNKFRKELNERKILPMLADAMTAIEKLGAKVKEAEAAVKPLAAKDLEDLSADALTAAVEEAKKATSEADAAAKEARNLARDAQNKTKAQNNHPTINTMNQDMNTSHQALEKAKVSLHKGEALVRTKKAVSSGEEKMTAAEAAVQAAKKSDGEGDLSLEQADKIDEACKAAMKEIGIASSAFESSINSAPPKAKEALQALVKRKTDARAAVNEVTTASKDRREAARSAHYLAEAEAKTKAAEDAAAKLDEAESPFLVGAPQSSSKQTLELLAKCDEAAKAVSAAVSAAKGYMGPTQSKASQFGPDASKKVKDGFKEIQDRLTKIFNKHRNFEKDSRDRMKEAKMVEAGEKTDEFEASVKKLVAAAEPFTKEGAENMSEADAEAPLTAFLEADKETSALKTALTSFLDARSREQKGNKEHEETIKKYQERLKTASAEVTEKKKSTAPHEKRALGKRLLAEAKQQVGGLEAELKKATEVCAPLLEQGGEEFLVSGSIQTLAKALQEYMKEKDTTLDEVFKKMGKKAVKEETFVKWLTDLPADIDHDELSAFSEERKAAIFKRLASGKGVTFEDFGKIFETEYVCVRATTLTNQFATEGGETVCKVEANTTVHLFGVPKTDEAKMTRSEAKVGEQTGWIIIQQEKNRFLTRQSPFKGFCIKMDGAVTDANNVINKVNSGLSAKLKQGGPATEGPLKEARDEMEKLKADVTTAQNGMDELKKKVSAAKATYYKKEQDEKNAHIEARNMKEAGPFLADPKAKVEALEAEAKACEEAAAPMVSLNGEELKKFATPASVKEAVEKHAAAVKEKADAARESLKEQSESVNKVTPQTGGTAEAKKQLNAMKSKVQDLASKASTTNSKVQAKCKSLVSAKMEPTAEGIRKAAQKKGKSIEQFFDSLKKGDKIPEDKFCKMLTGLEVDGSTLSDEMAKLVCQKLEADGISKDVFMKYVVLYYKVVRTIAFTDSFGISTCKTLRKGDEGEVVEVLEGPVLDESNGMSRIRCKSLQGDGVEGWITLSGSKGTAFLEKTAKPAEKKAAEKPAEKK
jgi:hypothetical protein